MERRTGTFTATGNDGRSYTVHIYTNDINTSSLASPGQRQEEVAGLKTLKTSDGMKLNRISKGTYQFARMGVILHSDSPDAP